MKKLSKFVLLLVALCAANASPALAEPSPTLAQWVNAENLRGRLIPAVKSIGGETTIEAAIDIELEEGWHTYWRVAGDAGLPPRFNWDASTNLKDVTVRYPAPKRKTEAGGFYTFGYNDRVTFPLVIDLEKPNTAAALNVKLDIMVCKEICIPEHLELSAELPAGTGVASSLAPLIEKAKEKLPSAPELPQLKIDTVVASESALVVSAYSAGGFEGIEIFATTPEFALTLPHTIEIDEKDSRRALITTQVTDDIENLAESLKGSSLTLTLVSGDTAIEKTIEY